MDRRRRPLLDQRGGRPWKVAAVALLLLLPWPVGKARAQGVATPTPTPAASATPWVQASPPPGMTATPKPAETPRPPATPKAPKPPKPPSTPKPVAVPAPTALPSSSPSPEDVKREMMHRRAEEQRAAAADKEAALHRAPEPGGQPLRENAPEKKEAVRLDQLPPDERAAYQRNLPLWRQLPAEERQDIRQQANERARQEMDEAYQASGLALDADQREVFDLRYRQERRRLERELQEKMNAERTRRLAEITGRLRQEFADKALPPASAAPAATMPPAPKKPAPTPATNPDALLGPGIGFLH